MFKNLKFIVLAACAGLFLFSCAKEEDEKAVSIQKRILEAYLEVNYPNKDYTVTKSGLVILDHKEGLGMSPEMYSGAYINYSIKGLNGNYQSTNIEATAKQLGIYSESEYYGPTLAQLGYGQIVDGLHEALGMMNKGAEMTVIIPPYLSAKDYSNEYNTGGYTTEKVETSTENLIYEIKMGHVVSNLEKFQTDSLETFKNYNYYGIDSLAKDFYFKKLSGTATDTIKENTKVDIWYVGRLLDGFVFDTNIEDTAKKYGLYNAAKEYAALEVTYKSRYQEMSSDSEDSSDGESYVSGFAKALKLMKLGDRAITFFSSDWGYGTTASSTIPAHSMLYFDIYAEKESE